MNAFIPLMWDHVAFWHVLLVSATRSVYNSMSSGTTQGTKMTVKCESEVMPVVCFVT